MYKYYYDELIENVLWSIFLKPPGVNYYSVFNAFNCCYLVILVI